MKKLKKFLINCYIRVCRLLFGINKNIIFFDSFSMKSYSDNPKPISEALHKANPKLKIIWAFKDCKKKEGIIPTYIKAIDGSNYFVYYRYVACCGVFVRNNTLPKLPKSKKQIYVQTWHGDKAIKKILHDKKGWNLNLAEELPGFCDYAIAGSDFGEKQYRTAFRYQGEVLNFGSPRNDILVRNDKKEADAIKDKLKMEQETKYLLYAPTFRTRFSDTGEVQKVEDVDLTRLLNVLEERDKCSWKCFLRSHPIVSDIGAESEDTRIINVAWYEDMADLLLVSDILITDYSSSAGDFALTGKPVLLYHSDVEDYLKNDRELCFDMDKTPFFIAKNQEEMENLLRTVDEDMAKENCKKIGEFYGDKETGRSSEKIAEIILERISH